MTPVFGHGALRLYLLSLLAESPRHGYELMQALEHRFGGTYSPSAGTIYPRLAKLEEEGLVTKTIDGRKATYAITAAGRAELAGREGELHALESEITDSVRRLASDVRTSVKSAMQALRADLASAERDARSASKEPHRPDAPRPPGPDGAQGAASTPSSPRPADAEWADASARTENPWSAPAPGERTADASERDARTAARMAIHDIDLALGDFRRQVREVARRQRGEQMSAAKAETVRRELEAALLRIKSELGS